MSQHRRKPCRTCGDVLTLRHFYPHPHYRDGRMNDCKRCKVKAVMENVEMKADYYRERKREIDARAHHVARRRAYNASERGRQVHRAVCRRAYRFRKLEQRA